LVNGRSNEGSPTNEDSEEAVRNRHETEVRIKLIIKQLRQDAKEHMKSTDRALNTNETVEQLPLTKICQKLKLNKSYCKKRE
jgi:hypothetical protein